MMGNQLLITSTQADSIVKTGVNPYHSRLFSVSFSDGSLQNMEPVMIDGVDVSLNQGAAEISVLMVIIFISPNGKKKMLRQFQLFIIPGKVIKDGVPGFTAAGKFGNV
jgi:hypothetical protein